MVGIIGVESIVVPKLEIGMAVLFSNDVMRRIVSLDVVGVILAILATLDLIKLMAGIGFMMMDKKNLEVQGCSKDNLFSNLIDLQNRLPGIAPIRSR